jgi:hypothetical protein
MPKVLTPTGAAKVQRQDFIPSIPSVKVTRATTQSIPNNADTVLTWDAELWDADNLHDLITNPSRLVCARAGKYLITGCLAMAANATGYREASVRVNGAVVDFNDSPGNASFNSGTVVTSVVDLAVGDYVEMSAYQNSGGALNATIGSHFSMTYIGPGFNASRAAKQVFYVTPTQFAALAPIDGDEAYLAVDVSNGVIWHLRYNAGSASAYKWEFLGGPPMFSEVATQESYSGSGAYVDLTTVGPSIALPRGGDYDIEIGAFMQATPGASAMRMSYAIGATAASDNDAVWVNMPSGSSVSPARPRRKTGLTAVTLTAKYLAGLNSIQFQNRWMSVRPARIS